MSVAYAKYCRRRFIYGRKIDSSIVYLGICVTVSDGDHGVCLPSPVVDIIKFNILEFDINVFRLVEFELIDVDLFNLNDLELVKLIKLHIKFVNLYDKFFRNGGSLLHQCAADHPRPSGGNRSVAGRFQTPDHQRIVRGSLVSGHARQ